jgi:predicted peroxiredoxin
MQFVRCPQLPRLPASRHAYATIVAAGGDDTSEFSGIETTKLIKKETQERVRSRKNEKTKKMLLELEAQGLEHRQAVAESTYHTNNTVVDFNQGEHYREHE